MTAFKTLDDIGDVKGKRTLVRVDLNVPVADGKVADATRIERVAPTITELSDKGAKVILLAHFGRPKDGPTPEFSLEPIARATRGRDRPPGRFRRRLYRREGGGRRLGHEGRRHTASGKHPLPQGRGKERQGLHRGAGEEWRPVRQRRLLGRAPGACVNRGPRAILPAFAGRTMQAELDALEAGLGNPKRPLVAIVGGAKVSTKIDLLMNLVKKVDALVIGGGMANTFLAARGTSVGKSLCERDLADTAKQIMIEAAGAGCAIILPSDGVVAREFKAGAANEVVAVEAVPADAMILDVGPETVRKVAEWIERAATLVWNGPLGAFEIAPFDKATVAAAKTAAAQTKAGRLISVAGGGDTVAALNHAGVAGDFTYVSTAGGAFLEWMEGKPLPGVEVLKKA